MEIVNTIIAIPAIYWAMGAVGLLVLVFVAKFLWALTQTIFKAAVLVACVAAVVGICYIGFKAVDKVGDVKNDVTSFVSEKTDTAKNLADKFNR